MKQELKIVFVALVALLGSLHCAAAQDERVLPVAAVTIYPGDTIQDSMLRERSFPSTYRMRVAVVEAPRALIGKVARRTLLPGEPIPVNAVDDPKIVSRGVPTQVVFAEGGLMITTLGSPLESGSLGEQIRVRNMDTGRVIMGTVQADGKIRIGGQ